MKKNNILLKKKTSIPIALKAFERKPEANSTISQQQHTMPTRASTFVTPACE